MNTQINCAAPSAIEQLKWWRGLAVTVYYLVRERLMRERNSEEVEMGKVKGSEQSKRVRFRDGGEVYFVARNGRQFCFR